MAQKSILEQALLQVETLEEAVKANAKGILASTMKQELNDLLKEQEEDEIDPEQEEKDVTDEPVDDETSISDEELDSETDEISAEDETEEPSIEDEMGDELDASDEIESSDEEMDDDVLDMTNASEEEVLKVFKAMKPEDGIVVKKDGKNIELSDEDSEYIIKLDDDEISNELNESFEDEEMTDEKEPEGRYNEFWDEMDKTEEEDEVIYEIELDDETEEKEEECTECGEKKIEATEAARTKWNQHGNKGGTKRAPLPKKIFQAGAINEEVKTLKKQNQEYKKALTLFKDKLNEVALFNASLAYATRLFTEHSTTKQEKLNILKRFDSVSTINECKNLYKTIKEELDVKKPITETMVEKINATPQSSSSEVLSESKAYENPQFKRMKELMQKIN